MQDRVNPFKGNPFEQLSLEATFLQLLKRRSNGMNDLLMQIYATDRPELKAFVERINAKRRLDRKMTTERGVNLDA